MTRLINVTIFIGKKNLRWSAFWLSDGATCYEYQHKYTVTS